MAISGPDHHVLPQQLINNATILLDKWDISVWMIDQHSRAHLIDNLALDKSDHGDISVHHTDTLRQTRYPFVPEFTGTENIHNHNISIIRWYLQTLNHYLKSEQTRICQDVPESLFAAEKAIASLEGLYISSKNIICALEQKFEQKYSDHPYRATIIRKFRCVREAIADLKAAQRRILYPSGANQDMQTSTVSQQLPLSEHPSCRYYAIGKIKTLGDKKVKARFCSGFDLPTADYYDYPLQGRLQLYLEGTGVNTPFFLTTFWPDINLESLTNSFKLPDSLRNFPFAASDIAFYTCNHQQAYLQAVAQEGKLSLDKPSLLLWIAHPNLHLLSVAEYTAIHQLTIEWAYQSGFQGVYKVASNCELLRAHAFGFRGVTEHRTFSAEALDSQLDIFASTAGTQTIGLNSMFNPDDDGPSSLVMFFDLYSIESRNIISLKKGHDNRVQTTNWMREIMRDPILYRGEKGRWPNMNGLSPEPSITFQYLMQRSLTGNKPPSPKLSCEPVSVDDLTNQVARLQIGRVGSMQLTSPEGETHPETRAKAKHTWRVK